MDKHTFNELLDKYLQGNASGDEKKLLETYYEHLLTDQPAQAGDSEDEQLRAAMLEQILVAVRQENQPLKPAVKKIFYIKRFTVAAAVLMVLLGAVTYLLFRAKEPKPEIAIARKIVPAIQSIDHGTDKAILTLANGSSLVLDSTGNGTVAQQGSSTVTKKGGHLLYGTAGNAAAATVFNTLRTPKGGQYHITLSDNTDVWLNASSSIRFPASFSGNTRDVEITGEVYFEVAKNPAKPFLVKVNDMTVEVLGTHFNIMAYADEASVNTTLLEGSVKVWSKDVSGLLHPGEQSTFNSSLHSIRITTADTEKAVAWKNGLLLFKRDDIKTIMRQLGRWYDVDISYSSTSAMPARLYSGSISKYVNLQEVLRILELGGIKFKTEGNRITVLHQ